MMAGKLSLELPKNVNVFILGYLTQSAFVHTFPEMNYHDTNIVGFSKRLCQRFGKISPIIFCDGIMNKI